MTEKSWDSLSIAAAILCVVPEIITVAYLGIPNDLGWLLPVVLLFSTAMLAAPQVVLLAFIRASKKRALRVFFVLASAGTLVAYALLVPSVDLASDAQAALAFPVFQFFMAGATTIAGALIFWVERRFFGKGAGS